MKKKTIIKASSAILIIVVGFIGMQMLSSTNKQSAKRTVDPEVRTVETENIEFGDITLNINGNGSIASQRNLSLISEASGQIIYAKNNLKNGTFVKKGEIILKIDPRETENNLYSMRSDFLTAVASLLPEIKFETPELYEKWHSYFSSLDINKEIPELPEITNSQEKIKIIARNILSKYFNVKNQEIFLSKHNVTAPFSGFIRSNGVIENSFVSKGQHLFNLEDAYNLEIAVPLLVDEINLIDFKNPPEVRIYSGENKAASVSGKVYRKDTKLNENSQTLNIYVTFTNAKLDPRFISGNYVNVEITGDKLANVASIPRNLLSNDNYIYTMEEGKLNRKKVDVYTIQNDSAIIKNTIPENTTLVKTILQKPLVGMIIQSSDELAEEKTEDSSDEKEVETDALALTD